MKVKTIITQDAEVDDQNSLRHFLLYCKDTLRSSFMLPEILNGKCALTSGYCTWLDGKYYEGEDPSAQCKIKNFPCTHSA